MEEGKKKQPSGLRLLLEGTGLLVSLPFLLFVILVLGAVTRGSPLSARSRRTRFRESGRCSSYAPWLW